MPRKRRTPREVRNALRYVLSNYRQHEAERGARLARDWIDPFSSAFWFDGWKDRVRLRDQRPQANGRASALPGTNARKLKIRTAPAKNCVSLDIAAPPVPPRPFAKPTLYHRRAGLYSHQQRICGTITGPLTRYSCASHERHCRLAFGPR
jgi:hypothetical protein